MSNPANQGRKPNWSEFYRNGLPKEVIVIDDDESPEPQQAQPGANQTSRTVQQTNGSTRHADKKRKTAASTAYDPVYHEHTSYSTTQTPYYDNSSSNHTASTDRTTSAVNTTAPTSLSSNGTYVTPLEPGVTGQKRKRATRQGAQDEAKEAKRRELENQQDPYSQYVPPPNPPIKAKDVYVPVFDDVRQSTKSVRPGQPLTKLQKSHSKNLKVDDDDGHYIVVPEADLTDRCKNVSSNVTYDSY